MHRKLFRSSPTRHRSRSSSTPAHSLSQTLPLEVPIPTINTKKGSSGNSNSNNRRSRSRSKSKSTEKETKTPRRSPISFRIRDKKEYRYSNNNTTSTSSSSNPPQSRSQSQQLDDVETAFDPWSTNSPNEGGKLPSFSPTSVTDSYFERQREKPKSTSNNYPLQYDHQSTASTRSTATNSYSISTTSGSHGSTNNKSKIRTSNSQSIGYSSSNSITSGHTITSTQKRIIPGVSQMTMRQTLAIIFSAFWERADLYTDVLVLEHDKPSPRQLRLAFFRQGRKVLATPIESPDDMTTLSMGMKPIFAVGGGTAKCDFKTEDNMGGVDVVQSGVRVSRKAKIKFQAINLAYDLLNDDSKRNLYDEWRLWHCRLPPPISSKSTSTETQPSQEELQTQYQKQLRIQQEKLYGHMNQYQSFTNMKDKNTNATENNQNNQNSNNSSKSSRKTNYQLVESSSSSPTSTTSKHHNGNLNESYTSHKSDLSSLPSILKEPTFGKKKKKKKQSKSLKEQYGYGIERKITWNEEVEELVIMECSRDDNSSTDMEQQYTSFESTKENIEPLDNEYKPVIPDPYSNSSIKDNWFRNGDEKDENDNDGKYSQQKNKKKDRVKFSIDNLRKNNDNSLASKADADSLEPGPVSFNFHSLDDSTVTFVDSSSPQECIQLNAGGGVLDDSLVEILDNDTPAKSNQGESCQIDSPGLVGNKTYIVEGNQKKNVKINVRTYQKESTPVQAFQTVPQTNVDDLFQRHRDATSYELDPEDMSIDTRSTKDTQGSYNWKPFSSNHNSSWGSTQNDCSVFGSTKECMFRETDCGAVDVGKGFQATLSNYINAVVTDMKEGLNSIGKKWEENKAKMSEGENPFVLNSFELDAMMDILKIEMNNLSPAVDDIKSFSAPKCGPDLHGKKFSCSS